MSQWSVMDRVTYQSIHRESRIKIEGTLATVSLCALILLLPVIFFWKLTFGGEVLYWGTPMLQFYPWRQLAVDLYQAGQVPLWNQYLGAGAPLAANLQSAVFYPLNFIFFLFPVDRAMGYSLVAHVALTGIFSFFLGRTLGFSRLGSTVTAITFMFSGFVISRAHFLSMTSVVAWLPLLLAASERVIRGVEEGDRFLSHNSYLNLSLLAFAAGMTLLAGHAQLAYYGFWFVLLYALYRGTFGYRLPGRPNDKGRVKRTFLAWLRLAFGSGLGIGFAAIQLIPSAELSLNSLRSGGASFDFAMAYSMYPWQLVGLIAPDFFGNPGFGDYWGPGNFWETNGYVGVLPLIFALLAVFRYRSVKKESQHCLVPLLVFIVLVSLVFAMGSYLPVFPFIFKNIPGFGLFQAPSRFLYLYTFSLAILAGAGISLFQGTERSGLQRRSGLFVSLGLGAYIGMSALGVYISQVAGLKTTFAGALGELGLLLSLAGIVLLSRKQFEPAVWSVITILFIVFDLFLANIGLNPSTDPQLYTSTPQAVMALDQVDKDYRVLTPEKASIDRFFQTHSFKTFGDPSINVTTAMRDDILPNVGVSFGILEANNYDPLQLKNAYDLRLEIDRLGPEPRLLNLFSAKYVISDTMPTGFSLSPVHNTGEKIWLNPDVVPRANIVHSVKNVGSQEEALAAVTAENFDPRSMVVLETNAPDSSDEGKAALTQYEEFARIVTSSSERVLIESNLNEPGYLVLNDSYYPGWRVQIDGQERDILRANYAFRAIELNPGSHMVEFRYEPMSFKVGAALSAIASILILATGGYGLLLWRRERKSQVNYMPTGLDRNYL